MKNIEIAKNKRYCHIYIKRKLMEQMFIHILQKCVLLQLSELQDFIVIPQSKFRCMRFSET